MQQVICYTASAGRLCKIKGDHIAGHTENVGHIHMYVAVRRVISAAATATAH